MQKQQQQTKKKKSRSLCGHCTINSNSGENNKIFLSQQLCRRRSLPRMKYYARGGNCSRRVCYTQLEDASRSVLCCAGGGAAADDDETRHNKTDAEQTEDAF